MKSILIPWVFVLAMLSAGLALADSPRVRFDVPQTVAVRDVTSREFALVHPGERLIEARLTISMLLEQGDARQVRELVHRVESSQSASQVVDFSPKTQLATTVVGATNIQRQKQQDLNLAFNASAGYQLIAKGNASGEYQSHHQEDTAFEQLPTLDLLTASGTIDRGRGVYFKLKPSPRTTLEGAYEYVVVLRVPRHWRAGLIFVSSDASGSERSVFASDSQSTKLGSGRFIVAAYQQGDIGAKQAAMRYAQAELALKRTISQKRGEIERRMYPTPLHRLGFTRDNALAKDWLETVMFRPVTEDVLVQLPSAVRVAVEDFVAARNAL